MNTFHTFFQKSFVFLLTLCIMFVATYVPHQHNKVEQAEAALATTAGQSAILAQNFAIFLKDAAILAKETLIAGYQLMIRNKEFFLDPLVWAITKALLASITTSIVNWINSGFHGSPMFVQDLRRHMLHTADHIAGEYLQELGGLASFICAPFQLDIQIALSMSYQAARSGAYYGTCTLTGAIANVDNFIKGAGNFGAAGPGHGWDTWYAVTSQPGRYTPYGNLLEAQGEAAIRIRNAQGRSLAELNFGEGFMSSKLCNHVDIAGVSKEQCAISTPGQVIEQALNFQLSSGSRSLIVADEINEILGALMGQLLNNVVTGSAGLLGLTDNGGNSTYWNNLEFDQQASTTEAAQNTSSNQTAIDNQIQNEITNQQNTTSNNSNSTAANQVAQDIINAYNLESEYFNLVNDYQPLLQRLGALGSTNPEINRSTSLQLALTNTMSALTPLWNEVTNGTTRTLSQVFADFSAIEPIATATAIEADETLWKNVFVSDFILKRSLTTDAINKTGSYLTQLTAIANNSTDPRQGAAKNEINNYINPILIPYLTSVDIKLAEIDALFFAEPVVAIGAYLSLLESSTRPPTQQETDTKVTEWEAIING